MNGDRSMETGRISFLAIDRYAERYGVVSADEFDRFLTIVTSMDGEYLSRSSTDGNSVDFNDVDGVRALFQNIAKRADGDDEEPE